MRNSGSLTGYVAFRQRLEFLDSSALTHAIICCNCHPLAIHAPLTRQLYRQFLKILWFAGSKNNCHGTATQKINLISGFGGIVRHSGSGAP